MHGPQSQRRAYMSALIVFGDWYNVGLVGTFAESSNHCIQPNMVAIGWRIQNAMINNTCMHIE